MEVKMLIYFAGPLFSTAERIFNIHLTKKLEGMGFSVFLPQRDGYEITKEPYNTMRGEEIYPLIFNRDREMIIKSDIFLFILDGRVPDEGACVELGIAYGQKFLRKSDKYIIGLHTDMRAALLHGKLNAMIYGALDQVFDSEISLLGALEAYQKPARLE
jgi:nucleoside 2-deoxyribosyltransferase